MGAGVRADQRFGDILERRLAGEAKGPRVYSLGINGADVQGYIQQIQDLPATSRVKQVVLCFYANDMPPRVTLQETLQQVAKRIGQASATLRMVADFVQFLVTPSAEAYARLLLTHYVEDDRTFDLRWKQLRREFSEFFQLATARSYKRPMIIVLPMLVDFEKAVFNGPMRRASNLAAQVGFEVVDTMPAFRADGETAERYRAAPTICTSMSRAIESSRMCCLEHLRTRCEVIGTPSECAATYTNPHKSDRRLPSHGKQWT